MHNIFFLCYKFLFSYQIKNRQLIRYIFVTFFTVFVLLILINSFTNGVLSFLENSIYQGYGHIYIELERKLYENQIEKNIIIKKLYNHPKIEKIFIYGITAGMAKFQTIVVPVYFISFYKKSLFSVHNTNVIDTKKDGYFVGKIIYDKYAQLKYKKIFIPIKENERKNILHINNIPITFSGWISCAWDEWNEKAIFCPASKLENYIEKPTLYLLNIYLKDTKSANEVISYIDKLKNKSIIKYYTKSISLLPEYNKFYNLIHYIYIIINSIIIIINFILIFVLLLLYINNNNYEWKLIWYNGIPKKHIIASLLLLFSTIYLLSMTCSILIGSIIIFIINNFKLIMINTAQKICFICSYNTLFIAKYFLIILIIFLAISCILFIKIFTVQNHE